MHARVGGRRVRRPSLSALDGAAPAAAKRIPIIVLQADKESTSPPDTDQRIHAIRPDAAITKVPGTTHFVPMERPYVVRDALKMLYEAMIEGHMLIDYVGAVRRTIDDSVGIMD